MGRKAIYQDVYHQLRYQILSGERPIGSSLPPERKMAEELQVSRNTVVKAYSELEAEGLIAGKMGSGRYVEPVTPLHSLGRINWHQQLNYEQLNPYPSYMADLLSLAVPQQGLINFAHGDGGKHTLLESGFQDYLKQSAERIESYYFLPINGYPALREWIVSWMGISHVSSIEQIVITSGSQEALQLVTTLLAKPGDTIAVEMPTYFGALQLFQSLGMKIIPIPVDKDGLRIDVLEGVLARYRPRFLYTIPTFHNPTGYTLSIERRHRLLALSERYGFPIIEDEAYRHLHLTKPAPPSLASLDTSGNVIYINTFSKVLFPGLRLGWIAASRPLTSLLTRLKELTITNNTLGQLALHSYLADGALTSHLERVRKMYRNQATAMGKYLHALRPLGLNYEQPSGGFYYWVSLPTGIDAREVLHDCLIRGVSFACGDMFLPREAIQPYIRLCYTHEAKEQIHSGMEILQEVLTSRRERF